MEIAVNRSFSFTHRGRMELLKTAEDHSFSTQDAAMILQCLKNEIGFTPFSDYLRRYVYLKSGMIGSYREIAPELYQSTIVDAFRETGTPCSLEEIKTPMQTRVKSWLNQSSAGRTVILLMGFGLSMTREDVNTFLMGALHDHRLDPEDPLEAICGYCYDHGYRYAKMKQLWQIFRQESSILDRSLFLSLQPAGRPTSLQVAEEDFQLLRSLSDRKYPVSKTSMQKATDSAFEHLYRQVSVLFAGRARLHPAQAGQSSPVIGGGMISPGELESILCASIPRDKHGNLVSELHSSLKKELAGKRFSRQHLYELLNGKTPPSRYDLITLCFLVRSVRDELFPNAKARYQIFVRETNETLQQCGFGPLYTADPYECFILMCLLSVDPLGTYSDVLELSYQGTGGSVS